MGLGITVGMLSDMAKDDPEGAEEFSAQMDQINEFLASISVKPHTENKNCPVLGLDMYGYSGLHYLRRLAAHLAFTNKMPEPGDKTAADDPHIAKYNHLLDRKSPSFWGKLFGKPMTPFFRFDHLMWHSDAEGYYLPVEFEKVLFPPDNFDIAGGGMIGSSFKLMEELTQLAKHLELPLDLDPESEEIWDAPERQGSGSLKWQKYGVESFSCLRLYYAAKHSIEHSCAMVFG